jgi:L-amino acid N-acyltransferase YncA
VRAPAPLIRLAAPSDSDAIATTYAHYVRTSLVPFDTVAPDADAWRDKANALLAQGIPFLVAEMDDAVAGFAYLSQYRPKAAYDHTMEDTVYVAPTFLGRGYGRLLLVDLLALAADAGAHQVIAVIADDGSDASQRLHASLGYDVVGRLRQVGFKHERWVDTVLMQRGV